MIDHQSTNRDAWNQRVVFTTEQKKMIQMSEDEIKHGRVISQQQLDEEYLKWLQSTKQNKFRVTDEIK